MANQLRSFSSGVDRKASSQPFHITTLAKSGKNKSKGKKLSYSKYSKNASFRVLSDEDLAYKTKKYLVYYNRDYDDQDDYAKKSYKPKEYKKNYSKNKKSYKKKEKSYKKEKKSYKNKEKPYKKEKEYYKEEKSYKEEEKPYKKEKQYYIEEEEEEEPYQKEKQYYKEEKPYKKEKQYYKEEENYNKEPVEYKADTVYVPTTAAPYMGIENYKSEYKSYAEPETYGPVYMPNQESSYSTGLYNEENVYDSDRNEPRAGISEYRAFGEAPDRLLFDGSETYGMPNNVLKPYDLKKRRNEFAKAEVDPRSTYYLGLLSHQNKLNKYEDMLMAQKVIEKPYTRQNSMPHNNAQLYENLNELQMDSIDKKHPQPYDIRYSIFDPKATPPLGMEGKQYVSMLAHHRKHK